MSKKKKEKKKLQPATGAMFCETDMCRIREFRRLAKEREKDEEDD